MSRAEAEPSRSVALEGCVLRRPVAEVEVVVAAAADRSFPAREEGNLGICLKRGPAHHVIADGQPLVYPADAISIRPPNCVWSAAITGPVAFLSVDVARSLLPESLRVDRMTFLPVSALPGFAAAARAMAEADVAADVHESVSGMIADLHAASAVGARELDDAGRPGAMRRARRLLADRVADCPTLDELAADVGANKFVLLRQFKRELGVTPRQYAVLVRLARAREELARGAHIAEVAARWGFADQAHLTRQFRSAFGVTPGTYVRHVRSTSAVRARAASRLVG
jgi:AraC family chemosensory pili system transcriptional regulator ChpD